MQCKISGIPWHTVFKAGVEREVAFSQQLLLPLKQNFSEVSKLRSSSSQAEKIELKPTIFSHSSISNTLTSGLLYIRKFCQIYSTQANVISTCKLVAACSVKNGLQWVRIFTINDLHLC